MHAAPPNYGIVAFMKGLVFALSSLAFVLCAPVAADELIFYTEDNPPWNMPADDGGVTGFATAMVAEAARRAGVEYRVELLPWRRAYAAALTEPTACVFAANRTEERDPLFRWVGPIGYGGWVLFSRPDDERNLASIDAARDLRVAAAPGSAIAHFLLDEGFTALEVATPALNARKLHAGRVDLWASGLANVTAVARITDTPEPQIAYILKRATLSLACNRDMPETKIAAMDAEMRALRTGAFGRRTAEQFELSQFVLR